MKHWQKLVITLIVAASALLAAFVFQAPLIAQALATVAGTVLAISMAIEMVKTLRSGSYGVDLLAITAIVATLLVGEYWAALIIIVMLVGGESLEDYAAGVAHRELSALLKKSPEVAHLLQADGQLVDVALAEVPVGSRLLIKPLEIIPLDGKLLSDAATLDESSITGESKPRELTAGDNVLSGSLNSEAAIELETTADAANSQFQKIVSLVKEAEGQPANFVRLADRYAVPFTIAAYVIAAVAYFLSGDPRRIAEVLVVASPCPLILAAPIAFVSGMSRSSKNGILVKNGTILEKLATAKSIFFDKTGTITNGLIQVDQVIPVESEVTADELVRLVYSLEKFSSHILAKAVVAYAEGIVALPVAELQEAAGVGISATVNGQLIKIGRASYASAPEGIFYDTALYVSRDGRYIGAISFADSIRKEAPETVQALQKLGLAEITMLTGDNAVTAEKIAQEVGISQVHAQLLPEQKVAYVKETPARPAIMCGDGVNDAPAMALADVGIAIGLGGSTTVASETADLVLLHNSLAAVPTAIRISRDTMRIARQAVIIGLLICIVLMFIAATGLIPATIGALFQEVVDSVSILYALRALRG